MPEQLQIDIDSIPNEYTRHEIRSRFLLTAEQKKKDLNTLINNGLRQGKTFEQLKNTVSTKIKLPNLYDTYMYSHPRFTWEELEMIISPLLADDLTINHAYELLDNIEESKSNNIIYPILDVLHKAYINLGRKPVIDAVFLNGGMTRFHPVIQRLERFFGFPPISSLDPDKSVALGASLHHHALHKGKGLKSIILAETLSVETEGNRVKHLIRAGTVLPTLMPVIYEDLCVPEGAREVNIAFYRGEGKTPGFPNVKILEQIIRLPNTCAKSEPLHVEVSVDRNKTLTFSGHLLSNPDIKIVIQVHNDEDAEITESQRSSMELPPSTSSMIPDSPFLKSNLPEPTIPELDVTETVDSLFSQDKRAKGKIKKITKKIILCRNREDFIAPLSSKLAEMSADEMLEKDLLYRKVINTLGKLSSAHPDHPSTPQAFRALLRVCNIRPMDISKRMKYYQLINMAVVSLARIRNPAAEQTFLELLDNSEAEGVSYTVLAALTKIPCTPNALGACAKYITSTTSGKRMYAALAIGKMSSREDAREVTPGLVLSIMDQLLEQLQKEEDTEVSNCIVYGISEVASLLLRAHQDIWHDDLENKVVRHLQEKEIAISNVPFPSSSDKNLRNIIKMAINIVKGMPLGEEQKRVLLFMRSKLENIQDDPDGNEKEE